MKPAHYWRKRLAKRRPERAAARIAGVVCDASKTIGLLSKNAQDSLSWISRLFAFLTTPFRFLGISGWKETGCRCEASGRPVRDAQHSTDGFWTIDVELARFEVGGVPAPPERFVRIEVEPDTGAHAVCAHRPISARDTLAFGGPVVIDTDGPFLEVHPDEDFRVERAVG